MKDQGNGLFSLFSEYFFLWEVNGFFVSIEETSYLIAYCAKVTHLFDKFSFLF